jgi:hypothetical protein
VHGSGRVPERTRVGGVVKSACSTVLVQGVIYYSSTDFFFQINAVLCEIVHIAIRIASQVLTRTHALPTCKDVDVSTLLATR